MKNHRVRLLAAGMGATALVGLGVMSAVAVDHQSTGTITASPMTRGETEMAPAPITTTIATEVAKARPEMKAVKPKGYH